MNKNRVKEIFEKYNSVDAVVRCPNGRAMMRQPLDRYAKAAVNLYGIIKLDEFVEIFNTYNTDQTTTDEVYKILLPNVLKYRKYGFYRDYLVHYAVLEDFDWVQYLEREQADKPRYLPSKQEFILYEREEYEDHDHWKNLSHFMWDTFGYGKGFIAGFFEIKNYILHSAGISELGSLMDKYGFQFNNEEEVQKFLDLLTTARNSTRIWENKGYTPFEMTKLLNNQRPKEMLIQKPHKIGSNEPCPCGSGKKYKKCCALLEKSATAHLSFSERKLFYETWLKLLDFVNRKLNVVNYKFDFTYPGYYNDSMIYKIREKLWLNPHLISEFINSNNTLTDEEVILLQSWEKHHIKGQFIILKYEPDYAVFMRMDKDEKLVLYGVKGITNSIADTSQRQLPSLLETVLLPFGEKIIYDSLLIFQSISFGEGMKKIFMQDYVKSKEKDGIITKLS